MSFSMDYNLLAIDLTNILYKVPNRVIGGQFFKRILHSFLRIKKKSLY